MTGTVGCNRYLKLPYFRFSYGHFDNQGWSSGDLVTKSPPWCVLPLQQQEEYYRWKSATIAKNWEDMVTLVVAIATYATFQE